MYLIEKGVPCVVGTEHNFSKGKEWVTRKDVTFWKEELVSDNGTWCLFFELKPTEGSRLRYWMSVRKKDVSYG